MSEYNLTDLHEDFKKLKRDIQSSMVNTINWGEKISFENNIGHYIDRFEFSFASKLGELMEENKEMKEKYCTGDIKLIDVCRKPKNRITFQPGQNVIIPSYLGDNMNEISAKDWKNKK